jgi:hypothetical protein
LRDIIAAGAQIPWIAQISANLLRDQELVDLIAASGGSGSSDELCTSWSSDFSLRDAPCVPRHLFSTNNQASLTQGVF